MVPMRKRRRDENGGESERAPPVSGFSSEECSAGKKNGKSLALAFVTLSTFEDLQRCSGSVGRGGKQAGVVSRILLFLFYFVFVG